jgi:hypothetical protein
MRKRRMGNFGFSDTPPVSETITDYDRRHLATYLRLLDSEIEGADWQEAVRVIFGLDPVKDLGRAARVHASHIARAHWMTVNGYEALIRASHH